MQIVERLIELDPTRGYARRAAMAVARLTRASGYRLQLADETITSEPPPSGNATWVGALEAGGARFGTLSLYGPLVSGPVPAGGAGVSGGKGSHALAAWGARLLANGLRNCQRVEGIGQARTYDDVLAMLEKTPLTPRERDVVGRLLTGSSTRQIAESTGLTVATVNTYLKRIFAKLGVHSRVELLARVTGTRGVTPTDTVRRPSERPPTSSS